MLFFFLAVASGLMGQASLSVQGVLTKSDGTAVDDGDYSMTFKLWTTQIGGTAVHTETIQQVETIGGVYSVVLGRNGKPILAPFDQVYYLGVSVGGGQELLPRPLLTHAPYVLALLGEHNQFPSTGQAKMDAIEVAGTIVVHALDVTGTASLPSLNIAGTASSQAFVAPSGAPSGSVSARGYSFDTGGDRDGGLFSENDGRVSIYTDAVERIKITDTQIEFKGKVLAADEADDGGYAFEGNAANGMFETGATVAFRSNGTDRILMESDQTSCNGAAYFEGTIRLNDVVRTNESRIYIDKPVDITSDGKSYTNYTINPTDTYRRYFHDGENDYPQDNNGTEDFNKISLQADGAMLAEGYYAASDRRIKKNLFRVDKALALARLQRLQVTDYRYIDEKAKGKGLKKGFIAQEVEEIEPAAITTSTHFIPGIYAPAQTSHAANGQIVLSMAAAHGLQKGDQVRIFEGSIRHDLTVEAATETAFTVSKWAETAPAGLFVFGKKVSDFKAVDYDRLFTLNIAATQELARRIEMLETGLSAPSPEDAGNAGLTDRQTGFGKQLSELARKIKWLENQSAGSRK